MRVSTNPTPNVRLAERPTKSEPCTFDLWEMERQTAGIEPGELATKASIDFHPSATDPILDVLLIVLLACLVLDFYHSIAFLLEVAR